MLLRFDDPLRALVLVDRAEEARGLVPDGAGWSEHWRQLDREEAYRLLSARRERPGALFEVRRALADAARPGEADEALLAAAAQALAGGWAIEIDRRRPAGGWARQGPVEAPASKTEAVEPDARPTGVPAKKVRDHWITVELVGEDGEPIPNEAVTVSDPAGDDHEGETDSQGRFTVTGIPEGDCQVAFPELDKDAWEAAS
ncbi:MAG: carboxypeptidase-like regulatory domain-containing protein [Marivibrio sp.]|uniref:carboxypeptidase-like regulatory domain-containing protein n=1 Tax=Marivibrio sp. TaxID=2039719 RepID=UPI0032ECF543